MVPGTTGSKQAAELQEQALKSDAYKVPYAIDTYSDSDPFPSATEKGRDRGIKVTAKEAYEALRHGERSFLTGSMVTFKDTKGNKHLADEALLLTIVHVADGHVNDKSASPVIENASSLNTVRGAGDPATTIPSGAPVKTGPDATYTMTPYMTATAERERDASDTSPKPRPTYTDPAADGNDTEKPAAKAKAKPRPSHVFAHVARPKPKADAKPAADVASTEPAADSADSPSTVATVNPKPSDSLSGDDPMAFWRIIAHAWLSPGNATALDKILDNVKLPDRGNADRNGPPKDAVATSPGIVPPRSAGTDTVVTTSPGIMPSELGSGDLARQAPAKRTSSPGIVPPRSGGANPTGMG